MLNVERELIDISSAYRIVVFSVFRYRQAYVDYKHALSVDSRLAVAVQGASRCQKYLQIADGVHWRCRLPKMVHVRHWEIPTVVLEVRRGLCTLLT